MPWTWVLFPTKKWDGSQDCWLKLIATVTRTGQIVARFEF